jgi:NAD(P)-dependent dehydrogenase (short-subunit alcohol dehydrogenase family)
MTREQRFVLGALTGIGAALTAGRMVRSRRAIDFSGRTVVITGGSRGLGLVMARQFAEQGARVCLLSTDPRELDRACRLLADEFGEARVLTIRCDVRRRADIRDAVTRILDEWVAIDVLVNNAGVIQVGPFDHMQDQDFENAMATHFWGPLHMIFEVLPSMRRRGFGRIVNISSIGGRIGVPHLAPYCSSKFALTGFSDTVRAELAPLGIRITTVSPGLMRTGSPLNAEIKGQHRKEYAWFAVADSLPGLSIGAERAAAQIIEACRYGDPELTISIPARAAVLLNAVSPALVARLSELVVRMLPSATGTDGDISRRGRDSESRWAPSFATTLSDKAAVVNNET